MLESGRCHSVCILWLLTTVMNQSLCECFEIQIDRKKLTREYTSSQKKSSDPVPYIEKEQHLEIHNTINVQYDRVLKCLIQKVIFAK